MYRRELALSAVQRLELEQTRARAPQAYLRERAAALLKIADGASVRAVALHGLLRRRKPDTVYLWLTRYQAAGLPGLRHHARRPRGFSPAGA